jgi:hypothetical protein
MDNKEHPERWLRHWISIPFIWMMIIPLVVLDIFLEIYHRICFPLYGLPLVSRKNYIKIDRHKLSYLKWLDKFSCMYCGYANGLINYAQKIGGETERYWCGIKHNETKGFVPPPHHKDFMKYGDKKAFEKKCKLKK